MAAKNGDKSHGTMGKEITLKKTNPSDQVPNLWPQSEEKGQTKQTTCPFTWKMLVPLGWRAP